MTESKTKRRQEVARARAAAARAQALRKERQQRIQRAVFAGVGVLAVVAALIIVDVVTSHKPTKAQINAEAPHYNANVFDEVTGVSPAVYNTVGTGGINSADVTPLPAGQPPLTSGGKPELLYVGAEYCPFCAAERWAIAEALSRFGTFSPLKSTYSAVQDSHIPTITFYQSTYTSKYLDFVSVETTTNVQATAGQTAGANGYQALQTPTPAEGALFDKYDYPPYSSGRGAIPFFDMANKFVIPGAGYNPLDLSGLSPAEVAAQLSTPTSKVAKDIDGVANQLTAAFCSLLGSNAPAAVCTASGVVAASQVIKV